MTFIYYTQYQFLNMLILIKFLPMQNEIKWTSSRFWTLSNSVLKKNTSVIDSIAGTQENIELSEPIHVCDEKN